MRIVIDTNVLISGVFFSGYPRKVIEAVVGSKFNSVNVISRKEDARDIGDEKATLAR